jgi:hypothetical protein
MERADLLAEIEDVLRTMPPLANLHQDTRETFSWLGRAVAAIAKWSLRHGEMARTYVNQMQSSNLRSSHEGLVSLMVIIEESRADLRMTTLGPITTAIGQGYVFDYFDEIRRIISMATNDLLFVDPYLDADFVSRYLPHVPTGVQIRMLAREKLATLVPATKLFAQQFQRSLQVRSAKNYHDRYFIVDGKSCYQSGASFKDGARSSPTTITQITDAFAAVRQTYENLWQNGKDELEG